MNPVEKTVSTYELQTGRESTQRSARADVILARRRSLWSGNGRSHDQAADREDVLKANYLKVLSELKRSRKLRFHFESGTTCMRDCREAFSNIGAVPQDAAVRRVALKSKLDLESLLARMHQPAR